MIAYCGIKCDTCPIYLATLEEDNFRQKKMREEIAKQCSEHYNMNLNPQDINDCDGCLSETERLFSGCSTCKIRKCAKNKNTDSCAYCTDYACELLQELFSLDPEAKDRLDEMRKKGND